MEDTSQAVKLASIISNIENAVSEGSVTNNMVAEAFAIIKEVKQDTIPGKVLSDENFSSEEKAKLADIENGANKYIHPETHSAEMITETKEKLFLTPEERQKLEGLENAPEDWSGTQTEFNALTNKDAVRWYFIVSGGEVVAVYRGSTLIHAVPNCVGQFSDDSTPDDWYWWPNGVKTALPVDPVTKRFSFYYPDVLTTASYLFAGGNSDNAFNNQTLIQLERVPLSKSYSGMLYNMKAMDLYPVIDGAELVLQYGQYYTLNYILMNSSKRPQDVYFRNTERVTEFSMTINNNFNRGSDYWRTRVFGLDLSRANVISNTAFGGSTALILAVNLGKRQELKTADLRSVYWGDDSVCAGARQSVIDTLLTNSFDRASAGYDAVTIRLTEFTASILTDEEKAAITAKGYTITTE